MGDVSIDDVDGEELVLAPGGGADPDWKKNKDEYDARKAKAEKDLKSKGSGKDGKSNGKGKLKERGKYNKSLINHRK